MTSIWRRNWDPLPAIAAVIALIMVGIYVGVLSQQGGSVAVWFLVGLAVAAVLATYGVSRTAPGRRPALVTSGVVMVVLGLLGLLSIGLPIFGAGVLALVAAARRAGTTAGSPTA